MDRDNPAVRAASGYRMVVVLLAVAAWWLPKTLAVTGQESPRRWKWRQHASRHFQFLLVLCHVLVLAASAPSLVKKNILSPPLSMEPGKGGWPPLVRLAILYAMKAALRSYKSAIFSLNVLVLSTHTPL